MYLVGFQTSAIIPEHNYHRSDAHPLFQSKEEGAEQLREAKKGMRQKKDKLHPAGKGDNREYCLHDELQLLQQVKGDRQRRGCFLLGSFT